MAGGGSFRFFRGLAVLLFQPCVLPAKGALPIRCAVSVKDWNGAVAQMGERVVRNDEVRGSIPLGSTNPYMTDLSRMNRFYPDPRRGCATRSGFLFICPRGRA